MTGITFTANRIETGEAVWLTDDLSWTEDAARAFRFADDLVESARRAIARAERRNEVVAVYEMRGDDAVSRPSARETIRAAHGPSITPPADLHGAGSATPPVISPSMYRYDAVYHGVVRSRAAQFRDQVERRLSGALTEEEFKPLRLQN